MEERTRVRGGTMPSDARMGNDFLEKQAKENAGGSILKGPVGFVLFLIAIGIVYGAYRAVDYFINIEKNTALKYVELTAERPNLQNGQAVVNVKVNNWNPVDLTSVTVKYDIAGASGGTIANGTVTIPQMVPAGDVRTFAGVKLAALDKPATRMQAELADVTVGPKAALPGDQQLRFLEIGALKDSYKLEALVQFVKDSPDWAPGFVSLGIAYEDAGMRQKAEESYRKALSLDANNANAHLHLGKLLIASDRKAAKAEIEKAKAAMPDDPSVKEALYILEPAQTTKKQKV